jgi:hypothetical protein
MNLFSLSFIYLLSRHQDIPQGFLLESFLGKSLGNLLPHQPMVPTSMNSHLLWMILPNLGETVLRKCYLTSFSFLNLDDSLEYNADNDNDCNDYY